MVLRLQHWQTQTLAQTLAQALEQALEQALALERVALVAPSRAFAAVPLRLGC